MSLNTQTLAPAAPEPPSPKKTWADACLKKLQAAKNLALTVVGVDKKTFSEAPSTEQLVWVAVGLYLLLMAGVTGFLVAVKVAISWGWWALPPVWGICSSLALLIEMMVLGTTKAGRAAP